MEKVLYLFEESLGRDSKLQNNIRFHRCFIFAKVCPSGLTHFHQTRITQITLEDRLKGGRRVFVKTSRSL